MIKIKRFNRDDLESWDEHQWYSLMRVLNQLAPTNMSCHQAYSIMERNLERNHTFIALDGCRPVGHAVYLYERKLLHGGGKVCHIEDVVVHEDYRGQGIATRLLAVIEQQAVKDECYKMILDCSISMCGFYCKQGFQESNFQMRKDL